MMMKMAMMRKITIMEEMRNSSVGSLESGHQQQLHPFRNPTTFLKLDDDDDDFNDQEGRM